MKKGAKKHVVTNVNDFWNILEQAGFDKECFGYDGIINVINMFCDLQGDKMRKQEIEKCEKPVLSDMYYEKSDILYNIMKERGLYNFD